MHVSSACSESSLNLSSRTLLLSSATFCVGVLVCNLKFLISRNSCIIHSTAFKIFVPLIYSFILSRCLLLHLLTLLNSARGLLNDIEFNEEMYTEVYIVFPTITSTLFLYLECYSQLICMQQDLCRDTILVVRFMFPYLRKNKRGV